jgi:hypothetical protein
MYREYKLKQKNTQKRGRVKPDFELLPQDQVAPSVVSQPLRNFIQYTHLNQAGEPLSVKTTNTNIIRVLKNTTIGFSAVVEDPSNTLDPYDTTNLKFVWKVNDSEIYDLSSLNGGRGTSQVYLDGEFVTPAINGEYFLEVSNKFGTTASEKFTIEVIDQELNPLLNKNLIRNSIGNKGLEDWDLADDIVVKQMEDSKGWTQNFASIVNAASVQVQREARDNPNIVSYDPRVRYEKPFVYCRSNNYINMNEAWNEVKFKERMSEMEGWDYKEWGYKEFAPQIIDNEKPWAPFNQFFPSPHTVDEYNGNSGLLNKGSLINDFGTLPTYFTRDKIKFVKDSGKPKSQMSQIVDISDIADLADGNVTGINKLNAHFFTYIGTGISKYNYVLRDIDGVVVKTLNTYILDKQNWGFFLTNKEFNKYQIPSNVVRIDLEPITSDIVDVNIDCIGADGSVIKRETITGPREKDIFAVKEKFLISTYVNKLFNAVTNFDLRKDLDVYIFGIKYFTIGAPKITTVRTGSTTRTKIESKNANTNWLKEYYPQYKGFTDDWSAQKWETGDFTLKGFDKGAAAMFGYSKNIQIPAKTRQIKVAIDFIHNSTAINDANAEPTVNWTDEDIYGEHLEDGGLYEYNFPKTAVTQTKLLITTEQPKINSTYPTYYLPIQNVWKIQKSLLTKDVHDETKGKPIFNYTNGMPTLETTDAVIATTFKPTLQKRFDVTKLSLSNIEPQLNINIGTNDRPLK